MVDLNNQYFKDNPSALSIYKELVDIENLGLSKVKLAEKAGVSRTTLYKHLNDDEFMKIVNTDVNENLKNSVYLVLQSVLKHSMDKNNFQDRKLFLELFNDYIPSQNVNTVTSILMDLDDETPEERQRLNIRVHADDERGGLE